MTRRSHEWQRIMDLNYFATVRGMAHFVPRMLVRAGAATSSTSARSPGCTLMPRVGIPYAAAKAAVVAMTENYAIYLEPLGIRGSRLIRRPEIVAAGVLDTMTIWTSRPDGARAELRADGQATGRSRGQAGRRNAGRRDSDPDRRRRLEHRTSAGRPRRTTTSARASPSSRPERRAGRRCLADARWSGQSDRRAATSITLTAQRHTVSRRSRRSACCQVDASDTAVWPRASTPHRASTSHWPRLFPLRVVVDQCIETVLRRRQGTAVIER